MAAGQYFVSGFAFLGVAREDRKTVDRLDLRAEMDEADIGANLAIENLQRAGTGGLV